MFCSGWYLGFCMDVELIEGFFLKCGGEWFGKNLVVELSVFLDSFVFVRDVIFIKEVIYCLDLFFFLVCGSVLLFMVCKWVIFIVVFEFKGYEVLCVVRSLLNFWSSWEIINDDVGGVLC